MILFLLVFFPLLSFSLICMLLPNFYEKAGYERKEAFIPGKNVLTFFKIIGRSPLWGILFFFPYINVILLIWMATEFLKAFGKRDPLSQVIGILFGYLYLPYLNFTWKQIYFEGKSGGKSKSQAREWIDALVFAVVAATIIRTFLIEAYTIPTSSMEKSLLVGDFLFVSKFHYGPRVPMTPIAFPFAHHTMPVFGTKAYSESVKLPYYRMPGIQKIKRFDDVVFNYPMEDFRPVDKKENYIKRCVGVPGDSLELKDRVLHINGKQSYQPPNLQFTCTVAFKNIKANLSELGTLLNTIEQSKIILMDSRYSSEWPKVRRRIETSEKRLEQLKKIYAEQYKALNKLDVNFGDMRNLEGLPQDHAILGQMNLPVYNKELMSKLKSLSFIESVEPVLSQDGEPENNIFPGSPDFPWNRDNYGPIYVPKTGMSVKLDNRSIYFYKRLIEVYEGNQVEVNGNNIKINGKVTDRYTFKMNYYFMMGDNRHNSLDSRYWGFVPENHIVGKAWFVWLSLDKYKTLLEGKIRFHRMFRFVTNDAEE